MTDVESFNNAKQWLNEIERHASENVSVILVGTKSDLLSKQVVDPEIAQAFAGKLNIPFIVTSAKNGSNVDQAFLTLGRKVLETLKSRETKKQNVSSIAAPIPSETIGFWSTIARGAGKFFMGILWPFQMLWSGVQAVGKGIARGVASLFSATSNPSVPPSANQPQASSRPDVYSSQRITDMQRAAGIQPPGSSDQSITVQQEVIDLQRQIKELQRQREKDRVSIEALLKQKDAPPPKEAPPPTYAEAQESPDDSELKSIQSALSSAESSALLDRACKSTADANSYLEKICLAVALIKDEKQRDSYITDLARKANEYEVLKSNLASLQERMLQFSRTIPVNDPNDNVAYNEIARCGMIVRTATDAITRANQLKGTARFGR